MEESSKRYVLRYDVPACEYGITVHPVEEIKKLCGENSFIRASGYRIRGGYLNVTIVEVNSIPDELPDYIHLMWWREYESTYTIQELFNENGRIR